MPGACCAVRSAAWRQKQRPPSLVLGPLRWWFKFSQLSTVAGSVSAGMELSASSSYVWACCSAGLLGLSLERKYISHNSHCAYNSAWEDAHVGSVSKCVRWQNVHRYCISVHLSEFSLFSSWPGDFGFPSSSMSSVFCSESPLTGVESGHKNSD